MKKRVQGVSALIAALPGARVHAVSPAGKLVVTLEAGMNAGVAAVKALPATATSMSPASGTTDGGSWSYSATRTQDSTNPDLYYWTVTSTGGPTISWTIQTTKP